MSEILLVVATLAALLVTYGVAYFKGYRDGKNAS